jgi:hypothetical protein
LRENEKKGFLLEELGGDPAAAMSQSRVQQEDKSHSHHEVRKYQRLSPQL